MADKSQFLGRLGSITQLTFALLVGTVASLHFEPGFAPRGIVVLVLYALPGLVGLLGVATRRPALLLAACVASAAGAFVAFSGVTLIFLVPALLFLVAAARLAGAPSGAAHDDWIAGIAQGLLAAAVVALFVGAGAAVLLETDSECWSAVRTPFGLRLERSPFATGEIALPLDAVSMGCSTGLISARGVALGTLLAGAGLALAAVAARRPRAGASVESGSPAAA